MVTVGTSLTQWRYDQVDLHDLHRCVSRWRMLLEANNNGGLMGLSEPERAILEACLTILSRVRRNALCKYYLAEIQMSFDEVNAD